MEHGSIEGGSKLEVFQTRLYEMKTRDIKIENIFDSNVDLAVELFHETPESKDDSFLMPFSTRVTNLWVPKGGSICLPLYFLPFSLKTQTCQLVLTDEKFGTFQYTLKGEVDLPAPIELPSPPIFYLESESVFTAKLHVNNPLLQNARRLHLDRLSATQRPAEEQKVKTLREKEKTIESKVFNIETFTDKVLLPASIAIQNEGASLCTTLNFNVPVKDYPFRFLLRSQDESDARVYETRVTVMPKPIKEIVEIRGLVKETLTKEFPFKNETDKDWVLRAQLIPNSDKNGSCFSGPKDFRIPKKSTVFYQLLFKPHEVLEAEAKLLMTNQYTGQQYEYDLKGYGEELNGKSE